MLFSIWVFLYIFYLCILIISSLVSIGDSGRVVMYSFSDRGPQQGAGQHNDDNQDSAERGRGAGRGAGPSATAHPQAHAAGVEESV